MADSHPEPARPRWILPVVVFSQFAGTSLWFAGNAILPELQREWSLPVEAVGYITSAVQLGFIFGTLVFAVFAISDRYSPRIVFFACALLGGLSGLGIFLAHGLTSLLVGERNRPTALPEDAHVVDVERGLGPPPGTCDARGRARAVAGDDRDLHAEVELARRVRGRDVEVEALCGATPVGRVRADGEPNPGVEQPVVPQLQRQQRGADLVAGHGVEQPQLGHQVKGRRLGARRVVADHERLIELRAAGVEHGRQHRRSRLVGEALDDRPRDLVRARTGNPHDRQRSASWKD